MSLKSFHIFFIGVSVLLSLIFSFWCFRAQGSFLILGIISLGIAVSLVLYGKWFILKSRNLPCIFVLSTFTFAPAHAFACAVCYGDAEGNLAQGSTWGVLALLGVTLGVLISFAVFFFYLARLSKSGNNLNQSFSSRGKLS